MKKRTAVRITAFSLAVLGAIIGFFVQMNTAVSNYRLETENVYSAALADFGAGTDSGATGAVAGELARIANLTPGDFAAVARRLRAEPATAGAVLVAIPITLLFIRMQKYYVEGVTGGAVKG